MKTICRRCWVSGRVQSVFYRRSTREKAIQLDVKGWVKNLEDGRVEVLLCGKESAVVKMIAWLHIGPTRAQVENVQMESIRCENHAEFVIREA